MLLVPRYQTRLSRSFHRRWQEIGGIDLLRDVKPPNRFTHFFSNFTTNLIIGWSFVLHYITAIVRNNKPSGCRIDADIQEFNWRVRLTLSRFHTSVVGVQCFHRWFVLFQFNMVFDLRYVDANEAIALTDKTRATCTNVLMITSSHVLKCTLL